MDEVEDTAANNLTAIARTCVAIVVDGQLVMWLQPLDSVRDCDSVFLQDLVQFVCLHLLPSYMCPHRVLVRTNWPLSPSGKVSRKLLMAEAVTVLQQQAWCEDSDLESTNVSGTARCVLHHCQTVLGLKRTPSLQLSLLQLGGDSLAALHITRHVQADLTGGSTSLFGEDLDAVFLPHLLLEAGTLNDYCNALSSALALPNEDDSSLPRIELSPSPAHRLLYQLVEADSQLFLQAALAVVALSELDAESLLAHSLVQRAASCTLYIWECYPAIHNRKSIHASTWLHRALQGMVLSLTLVLQLSPFHV